MLWLLAALGIVAVGYLAAWWDAHARDLPAHVMEMSDQMPAQHARQQLHNDLTCGDAVSLTD